METTPTSMVIKFQSSRSRRRVYKKKTSAFLCRERVFQSSRSRRRVYKYCFVCLRRITQSFNPAEAEEGFISRQSLFTFILKNTCRFNPAEAEEGFIRKLSINLPIIKSMFQSSRSRRRVYKLHSLM